MENLKEWSMQHKATILESGLNEDNYKKLQNAIVLSLHIANKLKENSTTDSSCQQQLMLKDLFEQTFELLSLLRDKELAHEWYTNYRNFDDRKKLIKNHSMREFVYNLDGKIWEFIKSFNDFESEEYEKFINWYGRFSQHYVVEEDIRRVWEVRFFFPKGFAWQRDCEFKNYGL